jgi:hypothetical protein
MRIAGETVGVRGLALLTAAATVGLLLAVHGWSARSRGLPGSLAGGHSAAATAPRSAAPPTAAPTQGPSASPSPSPPGPKLSSQSYAAYSFQVWPGPLSASAKSAQIGLTISVRAARSGIWVTAGVTGQPAPAAKYYAGGAKVYVVEASLGDDSGSSDYNLGDDALVVTDAQGRILQ